MHYSFEQAMQAVLDAAGIRHFKAGELCKVGRKANGNGPALKPPPAEFLTRPLPVLRVLDELRDWARAPVTVNSGYRDPAYNRAVGSTDGSQHVQFRAFDIVVKGKTPQQVYQWLTTHPKANELGIGVYPTFVHVDCRGHKARW